MQIKPAFLAVLLLCCAIALAAGCTGPSSPAQPAAPAAPAATQAQVSAQDNLVVSPTDSIPDNNMVSVTVKEKEYDATITVVFDGGKGQYMAKSAQVTLYRSDGQVITENLGVKKGDEVKLQGTRQTDRVVAWVSEVNGQTYKVADTLSDYRTR